MSINIREIENNEKDIQSVNQLYMDMIGENYSASDCCFGYPEFVWNGVFNYDDNKPKMKCFCYVAEDEISDEIVGFAMVESDEKRKLCNYQGLYVAEQSRNQGIGKRFLAKVEEVARQKGCGIVEILDYKHNGAYYRKNGFEVGKKITDDRFFFVKPVRELTRQETYEPEITM